jgi:hypothetical protein
MLNGIIIIVSVVFLQSTGLILILQSPMYRDLYRLERISKVI